MALNAVTWEGTQLRVYQPEKEATIVTESFLKDLAHVLGAAMILQPDGQQLPEI